MTRAEQLISAVQQAQFPYLDSLIHLFVGGSELHGAKVKDTDDLDIYGVYLEPPELVLGLEKQEFYVWSTAGDERRNGPDDIDVCLYSLRKWAGLAAKGNPTALHFLFSQNYAPQPEPWEEILKHRNVFLSRQASTQFGGFAEAQLRRLQGNRCWEEGTTARTNRCSWLRHQGCDARNSAAERRHRTDALVHNHSASS